MSTIYELFGFPLTDRSQAVEQHRKNAQCPFTHSTCDGGGNRYLSSVDVDKNAALSDYFDVRGIVASGVCSLQLKEGASPWIVCPRRLLALGRGGDAQRYRLSMAEEKLLEVSGYPRHSRLGIWSEVKVKAKMTPTDGGLTKTFDYTFDYIVCPLRALPSEGVSRLTKLEWRALRRKAEKAGYQFALRNGVEHIEDCPVGPPLIVEVMTSSTSGGNKRKRTQIPMAFEDAILGKEHSGPGINYRQVWARMVSQLIVKSEVGMRWGGKTVWVLQDTLVDYISNTTALDVRRFLAAQTSEVNMLVFSYGQLPEDPQGLTSLKECSLYAGPISGDDRPTVGSCFQDIIRAADSPPVSRLYATLLGKQMLAAVSVP